PAAAPAAIAGAVVRKNHRGGRLHRASGLRRFDDPQPHLPFRLANLLLTPRDGEVFTLGRKYQMAVAVRRKQTPSLALAAGREQQDCVSVRKLERYLAALRLLRRDDGKSIALVHPRARALITDEKLAE